MGNGGAAVARQMGRLFEVGTLAGLSEGELLDRFLTRRDEMAFEVLVERHGSLVMGVCRGVLGDGHDAEDAFQATFLLLVRKAGSIRSEKRLGGWLYRVAHRVATRAGRSASRRRAVERVDSEVVDGSVAREGPCLDLTRVVHEEVARLSENDRAVVVLCDLEGLTHSEAAARLKGPVGTVKGRLSRARDRLRGRLVRRGLTMPAGLVAATLAEEARAGVSRGLIASTVQAGAQVAGGQVGAGAVSASAMALAGGVARTMMVGKMKMIASLVLAGGVLAAGAGAVLGPGDGKADQAEPVAAKAPEREDLARRIVGTWELQEWERRQLGADGEVRVGRSGTAPVGPLVRFRDDGTCEIEGGNQKYKVDDSENPARINVYGGDGKPVMLGLVRMSEDGETLTLYMSHAKRPADFESVGGDERVLMVFKRQVEKKEDLARKLVGTWDLKEGEVRTKSKDGGLVSVPIRPGNVEPKVGPFVFREDGTCKEGDGEGRYTIDSTREPAAIDLFLGEEEVEAASVGILRISDDGETLTLYYGEGKRPGDFEERGDGQRILLTMTRRAEKAKEELGRRIVGGWDVREMEIRRPDANGKAMVIRRVQGRLSPTSEPSFTFGEDGTLLVGGAEGKGQYKIDAGREPAGIDLMETGAAGDSKPGLPGIFKISDDGGTLTLYTGNGGRPADFEETGPDERIFTVLDRRVEKVEEEAEPEAAAAKAEVSPIEGVWKILYVERDGAIHRSGLGGMPSAVRFGKDGVFRLHEPIASKALRGVMKEAKYTVVSGTKPAGIDLEFLVRGPEEIPMRPVMNSMQRGIYRIDGETMSLCLYCADWEQPPHLRGPGEPFTPRPDGFETGKGDGRLLMVLERGTEEDFETERPANELVGTWKVVEMIVNGKREEGENPEVVILPDRISWGTAGMAVAEYVLRPETSPRQIDFRGGNSKDEVDEGIYERRGELLRLCLALGESRGRPESFDEARVHVEDGKNAALMMTLRYVGPPREVDVEEVGGPAEAPTVVEPPLAPSEVDGGPLVPPVFEPGLVPTLPPSAPAVVEPLTPDMVEPRRAPDLSLDAARIRGWWAVKRLVRNDDGERRTVGGGGFVVYIDRESLDLLRPTGEKGRPIEGIGMTRYRLGPEPGQIEMNGSLVDVNIVSLFGIYKIEGDVLTLCYNGDGGARPEGFEAKELFEVMVEYKRAGKKEIQEAFSEASGVGGGGRAKPGAGPLEIELAEPARGLSDEERGALVARRDEARIKEEVLGATVSARRERLVRLSEQVEPLERYLTCLKAGSDEKTRRALASLMLGEKAEDVAVLSEEELRTVLERLEEARKGAEVELKRGSEELRAVKAEIDETTRGLDAPSAEARKVRPGDVLVIEVLEALPGRPITGERVVRADGTVSLGFYGDLAVAGLDRTQIKERLIVHLRKYLDDGVLGLTVQDESGEEVRVAPAESDRVFVDDSAREYADAWTSKIDALERRVERAVGEADRMKRATGP